MAWSLQLLYRTMNTWRAGVEQALHEAELLHGAAQMWKSYFVGRAWRGWLAQVDKAHYEATRTHAELVVISNMRVNRENSYAHSCEEDTVCAKMN